MAVSTLASNPVTSAWWVRRWTKFMQQLGVTTDAAALRGLRVKRLEVQPGLLQAQVVERDNGVTLVEVRFPTLTDAQWEAIIDALGSQALFVAQLLAGNMPAEIEQVFADAGSWLLPATADDIEQLCTPAGGKPTPADSTCRPLVAAYLQLSEMVTEDPWLLLRLRGCDREQVLAALQEKRNRETQALAAQSTPLLEQPAAEPAFYTPPLPNTQVEAAAVTQLDARIADFWGRRKVLEDVHHHLVQPAVELALLRRLGPINATADGAAAYAQLQTVYHRVTRRAWDMAFTPDDELTLDETEASE
ncbi:MAG TPA: hypothetical protein GX400_09175 [Chloroflexi bacterium]|nr:hypothetical protein [Chloroflexota bacterium]